MAIRYKEKQVPATEARTIQVDDGYTCDFCGKQTQPNVNVTYGATLRSIEKESSPYGDGGYRNEEIVDCCIGCWKTKVMRWIASQGITPRKHEVDW